VFLIETRGARCPVSRIRISAGYRWRLYRSGKAMSEETPSAGLKALHEARDQAARDIADALQRILPDGFRGKITVVVDKGIIQAQHVSIELRSEQT
jgi:hypothetical protein